MMKKKKKKRRNKSARRNLFPEVQQQRPAFPEATVPPPPPPSTATATETASELDKDNDGFVGRNVFGEASKKKPVVSFGKKFEKKQEGKGGLYPVLKMIKHFKDTKEKERAKTMYKYLKNRLKWNEKGELIHKGNPIKGSNIIKLMKHALRKTNSTPIGYKYFYKVIGMTYFPAYLIKNMYGKYLIGERNRFRPPGSLTSTTSVNNL